MREIKFRVWDNIDLKMSRPFELFEIYAGQREEFKRYLEWAQKFNQTPTI